MLFDGQVVKQLWIVGHVGRATLEVERLVGECAPTDSDPSTAGWHDPAERTERGGLSGSVGTNQAEDLSRFDLKGQATHGDVVIVRFAKVLDVNHGSAASVGTMLGQNRRLSSAWRGRTGKSAKAYTPA